MSGALARGRAIAAPGALDDAERGPDRVRWRVGLGDPAPIVDHRDARRRAIEAYASVRGGRGPHDGPER